MVRQRGGGAGSGVITGNYFSDDFNVSFHVFENFEGKKSGRNKVREAESLDGCFQHARCV